MKLRIRQEVNSTFEMELWLEYTGDEVVVKSRARRNEYQPDDWIEQAEVIFHPDMTKRMVKGSVNFKECCK